MPKDVFISYSTRDKTNAEKLCMVLEELGLDCWIAPRDIPASAEFEVAILDAIDQSQAIMVVLSSDANASPYVKNEVNRAFSREKAIFTFRVEDIAPAKALEFYLARHQWTDGFPPPVEERIARMARALLELKTSSWTIEDVHAERDVKGHESSAPSVTVEAGCARREEVAHDLDELVAESKKVLAEARTKRSFEYGEERLKRWKARVVRFLDSNVSFDEAATFASLHTALGGANNMEHFESSFARHLSFLEALIEAIKTDVQPIVKPEAKESGNRLPVISTFTYKPPQQIKDSSSSQVPPSYSNDDENVWVRFRCTDGHESWQQLWEFRAFHEWLHDRRDLNTGMSIWGVCPIHKHGIQGSIVDIKYRDS